MSTGHGILQKTQQALQNYVLTEDLSFNPSVVCGVSRGKNPLVADEEESGPLPMVVCDCRRGTIDQDQAISPWKVDVTVSLHESADDTTEDLHLAHGEELMNALMDTTLAADLSTEDDYTCFLAVFQDLSYEIAGRRWVTTLNMQLDCAGFDIT